MGDVIDFDAARARRVQQRAAAAVMHPALRWAAGEDQATGHRRAAATSTAWCGAAGTLTIAGSGARLCPDCYPGR